MEILSTLTKDLDWRESELASMRLLISSPALTDGQRLSLLRAAWALLYAHYEGFCKTALFSYYEAIRRSGVDCRDLPVSTKLFALSDKLREMRKIPDPKLLAGVLGFGDECLDKPPRFPEVDTQSNLWPGVLISLLEAADLCTKKVDEHQRKLKTLVARRNDIAHGKDSFIPEVKYYHGYEEVVYEVMYDLALQLDERLTRPPYDQV